VAVVEEGILYRAKNIGEHLAVLLRLLHWIG
jgi:hypothetical protein